jgi:hypothetical protein
VCVTGNASGVKRNELSVHAYSKPPPNELQQGLCAMARKAGEQRSNALRTVIQKQKKKNRQNKTESYVTHRCFSLCRERDTESGACQREKDEGK